MLDFTACIIKTVVTLITLFLMLCHSGSNANNIILTPVSVTVPLLTSVNFSCEGNGYVLTWIIQSTTLSNSDRERRDISITDYNNGTILSSVLTVPAVPINDNLAIGCRIIFTLDPFNETIATSSLSITGISQVRDIKSSLIGRKLFLTWQAPIFVTNLIAKDTTLEYNVKVRVTNMNDELYSSMNYTNITYAELIVPVCQVVNISVIIAVTADSYVSEERSYSKEVETVGNYSLVIETDHILFNRTLKSFKAKFILNVKSSIILCKADVFIIGIIVNGTQKVLEANWLSSLDTVLYTVDYLLPERSYKFIAKIVDNDYQTIAQDELMFTTYYVQDLDVSKFINGLVNVQCLLVEGSTADGCHVIFTTDQGVGESFNITESAEESEPRSVERNISLLVSGNYTVVAYDIVNGTIIGPSYIYPTLVEIVKQSNLQPRSMTIAHLVVICFGVIFILVVILICLLMMLIWWIFKREGTNTIYVMIQNPTIFIKKNRKKNKCS